MTAFQLGEVFGALIGPLLLIGTALYLFKQGSVSYRDALLNRWVIAATLALAFVNFAVRFAPPASVFAAGERAGVYTGCIESALARMDRKAAGETCTCMITEIENTFTHDQYKNSSASMQKTGIAPPEFGAIAAKCEPKGK